MNGGVGEEGKWWKFKGGRDGEGRELVGEGVGGGGVFFLFGVGGGGNGMGMIGQASPRDRIWGVGFAAEDAEGVGGESFGQGADAGEGAVEGRSQMDGGRGRGTIVCGDRDGGG